MPEQTTILGLIRYLISLVLAQRIGIARFSNETTKIAEEYNKGFFSRIKQREAHIDLQERYVLFKNQVLVLEPSCQEQGIDIYRLLQKQLLIDEEQEIFNAQIQSLYEVIAVWKDNFWAKLGLVISVLAGAYAVLKEIASLLMSITVVNDFVQTWFAEIMK